MKDKKRIQNHRKSGSSLIPLFLLGSGLVILGVVAFLLLSRGVAAPAAGSPAAAYSTTPAKLEYPAPDLRLQDINGSPTTLEDLRGHVVLVNNWATWCPPCRKEMPDLEAYYKRHKDKEFTLVAIDAGDPISDVIQFAKQYGLTFPIWMDPGQEALRAFRNPALPSSYVIDRSGIVRLAWSGAVSLDALEEYVTPMLED